MATIHLGLSEFKGKHRRRPVKVNRGILVREPMFESITKTVLHEHLEEVETVHITIICRLCQDGRLFAAPNDERPNLPAIGCRSARPC